jgi:hypothetical protein
VKGKTRPVWPVVILGLLLVSPALQAFGAGYAKPSPIDYSHYHFGFEESTKPWAPAADGAPGYSLTTIAGDNGCADMFDGVINNHYARLNSGPVTTNTRPPIPATWMVAGLPAGLGEYFVHVQWSARLDKKVPVTSGADGQVAPICLPCYPVAYIGSAPPQQGAQLKIADAKSPLDNSWRSYQYSQVVEIGEKGLVFVALGWNGTGMSIGTDCVEVSIYPILEGIAGSANH